MCSTLLCLARSFFHGMFFFQWFIVSLMSCKYACFDCLLDCPSSNLTFPKETATSFFQSHLGYDGGFSLSNSFVGISGSQGPWACACVPRPFCSLACGLLIHLCETFITRGRKACCAHYHGVSNQPLWIASLLWITNWARCQSLKMGAGCPRKSSWSAPVHSAGWHLIQNQAFLNLHVYW